MSFSVIRRVVRAALRSITALGLTFLGLLLVTFFIGRVIPVDPVLAAIGDRASADVIEEMRIVMGLHLPLYQQFWLYLTDVLSGDFGISVLTANPVISDIIRLFPATLELASAATVIGIVLGVPLGVVAATHQGRWQDHTIRIASLVGYSMPIFWLSLIGLLVFYAGLGLVEGPGRIDVYLEETVPSVTGLILIDSLISGHFAIFRNALSHLVLPASILGYFSLAYIARMTRVYMIEELSKDYIMAARAKGLSEASVVWRHALGNVRGPLITVIALAYAGLLEGSVLTETVFSWPGLGRYITSSLLNADMNAVLGGTLVVGAVFVLVNQLADFLYRLADPRIA
ncbi:MAG: ABC transporter permease [Rhodospirillaceae bacterium]|nr:ABC transporter permease [Rhodospirillaceae bacterium]